LGRQRRLQLRPYGVPHLHGRAQLRLQHDRDPIGACGSRDRNTIVAVNGSYQLGPGVFWEVGVFHAKLTGNEWNNGTFVGATPIAAASRHHHVGELGARADCRTPRDRRVDRLAIVF